MADLERLLAIRSAALDLLAKSGAWESAGATNFLVYSGGAIKIAYRTPFQKLPTENDRSRYERTLRGFKRNLPYGIDVWYNGRKVMNIEWDDAGDFEVLSFRRGEWEAIFTTKIPARRCTRN